MALSSVRLCQGVFGCVRWCLVVLGGVRLCYVTLGCVRWH